MRFMVIVHPVSATDWEAGKMPDPAEMAAMGTFNEQLIDAGVMLMGEGLQPSSAGTRITFAGGKPAKVTPGPFSTPEERVGGFWIWQCASQEEAVEWAKKAPMGEGDILEIRKIMESSDFGEEVEQEENKLREKMAKRGA